MNDTEIYLDLLNKTSEVVIPLKEETFDLAKVCKILAFLQITQATLDEVDFSSHEQEFLELFINMHIHQMLIRRLLDAR